MKKNYISDKDIEDFEEDSLRRQHYRNRKGIAFRQRLSLSPPSAQPPRRTTIDPKIYNFTRSDDNDIEGESEHEEEQEE
jgi:hypothetical protein